MIVGFIYAHKTCRYVNKDSLTHAKRFMSRAAFKDVYRDLNALVPMSESEAMALIALANKSGAQPVSPTPVLIAELEQVLRGARAA